MKARRQADLEAMLASEDFGSWWGRVGGLLEERAAARSRYDEVLERISLLEFRSELAQKNAIDTLYASGEAEDRAATFETEMQDLENRSMELVAAFEEQRVRASEAWMRLTAVEKHVEDAREASAGSAGKVATSRVDPAIGRLSQEQRAAQEVYERENARKARIWQDVEALWARASELSLERSEQSKKAARVKREAERLFGASERDKNEAEALRKEAEELSRRREALDQALAAEQKEAERRFEALVGDDFLFWLSREDDKRAYCVPLAHDQETYNVEVVPCTLYEISVKDGVEKIDPILPRDAASEEEADRRLEAWFLEGRLIREARSEAEDPGADTALAKAMDDDAAEASAAPQEDDTDADKAAGS